MKGITNVVMQIVLFVKQQSRMQDIGITSGRIQDMRMIVSLCQRHIQVSKLGGKIITVHEILVLITTGHIKDFFTLKIKSSSYTETALLNHE
jgi:hypothetical protein